MNQKSSIDRTTAGILALATSLTGILAWAGLHKFLMGNTREGIIWIIASACTLGTFGFVMGILEGITYLTMTDQEFQNRYVYGNRKWL